MEAQVISIKGSHSEPRTTTLGILKPDVVQSGQAARAIGIIAEHGFRIVAIRMDQLTEQATGEFYREHEGRPYFSDLVEFMSGGPAIFMVLQRENAVQLWRNLMGATRVEDRLPGTLRHAFGSSLMRNAVHGSDSETAALREINFFFPTSQIFAQ